MGKRDDKKKERHEKKNAKVAKRIAGQHNFMQSRFPGYLPTDPDEQPQEGDRWEEADGKNGIRTWVE